MPVSHVATIEIEITNLSDLKAACAEMGLVFEEGQDRYEWFGKHVGDFALPEGFAESDLGRCEHAIRLSDSDRIAAITAQRQAISDKFAAVGRTPTADDFVNWVKSPYEIGVVRRRDGKPGWALLWDFWQGGYGLQAKVGENGGLLKKAIATAASIRTMAAQGYRCQRQTLDNGSVKLVFQKG